MPSVADRHALAATRNDKDNEVTGLSMKTFEQSPKPNEYPFSRKDTEGRTVVWYIDNKGAVHHITEAALPHGTCPYPPARAVDPAPKVSDLLGYITEHGQEIRRSLASAFEWAGVDEDVDLLDPNSVYNAHRLDNPHHGYWLKHNRRGPTVYADTPFPINIQVLMNNGKGFSNPNGPTSPKFKRQSTSSSSEEVKEKPTIAAALEEWKRERYRTAECSYWRLSKCKNGADCMFLHPVDKAPNFSASISSSSEEYKRQQYGNKECSSWP